ncbi:phosphoribosylformylglycinamidine synthase subunit PurQ [Fructilactobacillus sp. Tb1]|uniref:phosphoribosylformylglycinamidine synthase subunit PurQ n=1 Tax=Fructilactobacillus sp. Tb1 TaxID=3422304 RepID=UPI003D2D4DF8
MKAAVIQFPGSNCDLDLMYALDQLGFDPELVDHNATDLSDYDAIFLPGGFSFGDYLRSGAVARFSPIIEALKAEDAKGKIIVGICNGFQILTEAGLLPGQLMMNEHPGFICDEVDLQIENGDSNFSKQYDTNKINLPVAHGEGRYVANDATIKQLEANHQVIFKYLTNVNGSTNQIAGITNQRGNVFGMMPHPERAIEAVISSTDGKAFFTSILNK